MQRSKLKIFIDSRWSVGVFVFLIASAVYLLTLAPGIFLEDSAELITAAATLGIAHPSGYPLYVLLGKVFSLLSFGHAAGAVNFMSAFFAALSAALLAVIVQKLTQNKILAVVSGLILIFTKTFWSQSTVAEVYTLHTALFLLIFWIWLNLRKNFDEKYIYWLALMGGLALTNHLLTLLYLPVYLIYFLANRKKFKKFAKVFFISIVLFVVGLSLYLYLPWRSLQEPLLDWGNPETLQNFWAHVSRAQYADISLAGPGGKLLLAQTFFTFIADELSWPLLAVSLAGVAWLLRQREQRSVGWISLGLFATSGLAVVVLRGFGWSAVTEEISKVYFLPALIVVLIWLAIALNLFWEKAVKKILEKKSKTQKKLVPIVLIVILFFIPAGTAVGNWSYNDLRQTHLVESWSRQALESLPEQAVLLLKNSGFAHDTQVFAVAYQQYAQKLRPDVLVVDDSGVFGLPERVSLEPGYLKESFSEQQRMIAEKVFSYAVKEDRPFYSSFPAATLIPGTKSTSNGLVYATVDNDQAEPKVKYFKISDDEAILRRFAGQDFMASILYSQAAGLLPQDFQVSQRMLIRAIELDNEPNSHEFQLYLKHRQAVLEIE